MEIAKWLRKPLVYGRLAKTRCGNHIQPFGIMFFEHDGSIALYNNENEYKWEVKNGELYLLSKNDFATVHFFTEEHGVLVGLQTCDTFAMNVAIVPWEPFVSPVNFKYVIASCETFIEKTALPLVAQLRMQNIPAEDIKVVAGDGNSEKSELHQGVEILHSKINAWEFTALIEASRGRFDFDHLFLLHDTCDVGPNFHFLTKQVAEGYDYNPAEAKGRANIGLYSKEYLTRIASFMERRLPNICKRDAVVTEMVSELIQRSQKSLCYLSSFEDNLGPKVDRYNTGSLRVKRQFHSVDLFKYTKSDAFQTCTERIL